MGLIKRLWTRIFKKYSDEPPWLEYYSEEERAIKFTDKSIYNYMESSIDNKDYYALNYFGNRITYGEMLKRIDLISRGLLSLGVKKGDVVSICMPNTPEAVIAFYACNKIGAVADMIHPLSAANEIKSYIEDNKSRVLFLYDANYEKVCDFLDETTVYKTILLSVKESMPLMLGIGYQLTRGLKIKKPKMTNQDYISWSDLLNLGRGYRNQKKINVKSQDLAIILHSGGTTGKSKGIMVSNYNFNAEAQQCALNVANVRVQDKIMTILPIFHGFGLGVCVHCPLTLNVEVILIPEFDGKRFHHIIQKYKPNVIAGVPTLWEAMLSNKRFEDVDLSCLKYVISGGDYLTISMEEKMNKFLRTHGASISISKGYGMTESVAATAYTFDGTNEPGSIGIPMIGNNFCICKPETTEELPYGEEGEICVNGPTVMMGYWENVEETHKVLKKHKDGKIWLHTGDVGYIALNGVIYFTQRLKRMIVSSGFNLYPSVIEEVIEKHPLVKKCCVIGVPHKYKISVAKAFVVLDGEPSKKIEREIRDICMENLAQYSQPKYIEFRDELPKTLYNKIDYKTLENEEIMKNNEAN